jgi:hypothetical protein
MNQKPIEKSRGGEGCILNEDLDEDSGEAQASAACVTSF